MRSSPSGQTGLSRCFPGSWGRFRHPDLFDWLTLLAILFYILIFTYLSLVRYNTLQLEYDLAIFHQALWNTATHGELLANSIEMADHHMVASSHFGVHFSPILFLIVPLYLLAPVPQTLLVTQTLLLALGAFPLYLLGREILGKETGCLVAGLYLIYSPLHGVNLYDFHEVAFVPLLVGSTLYGFLTGRKNLMLLSAVLSLCVKEDVFLLILMIGLMGLVFTRKESLKERWQFLALVFLSLCTVAVFFFVIQPIFVPVSSGLHSGFLTQYHDPIGTLGLNSGDRENYVLQILAPLLLIPLAAPEMILILIPSFLEIILSGTVYFSVYFHYSALLIPGIFSALIVGLSRIRDLNYIRSNNLNKPVIGCLVISSLIGMVVWSPAVDLMVSHLEYNMPAIDDHREYVEQVISLIPPDASISTQYNLLPQAGSRRNVWVDYHEGADIILLDHAFEWRARDFTDNSGEIQKNYIRVLDRNYLELFVINDNPTLIREMKSALSSF